MLLTIWKRLWVLWELSFLWILDRKDEILWILFIVLNHIGPAARAIITQGTQNRGREEGRGERGVTGGRIQIGMFAGASAGLHGPRECSGAIIWIIIQYIFIPSDSHTLSCQLPSHWCWGFHCLGWSRVQGRIKNSVLRFRCQSWLRKPISERKKD